MMDTTALLLQAEEILQPFGHLAVRPAPDRLDVTILPTRLEAAVRALIAAGWGYLVAITGVDRPGVAALEPEDKQWSRLTDEQEGAGPSADHEGSIELLYTFCSRAAITTLRTSVRYSSPVIHSICDTIPSATLYERELIEMFGVRILSTPNRDKLLLPDDWPDGVYPLRKSFKGFTSNLPFGEN
jgi:NADH:ubiquinone oxidoreductase subunit C